MIVIPRKRVMTLNNEEYLRYEGTCLIENSLSSFLAPFKGMDLRASMSHHFSMYDITAASEEDFFWEYILLRLYVSEKVIRHFKAGCGNLSALADGLRRGLEDFPMQLKAIAMKREMNGSFLLFGKDVSRLTADYIEKRFHEFESLSEGFALSSKEGREVFVHKALSHICSLVGMKEASPVISYFIEETRAFLSSLTAKLSHFTPQTIYKNAKHMTPAMPEVSGNTLALHGAALLTGGLIATLLLML